MSKNAFEIAVSEHSVWIESIANFDEAVESLVHRLELVRGHSLSLAPVRPTTRSQHQLLHSFEQLVVRTALAVRTATLTHDFSKLTQISLHSSNWQFAIRLVSRDSCHCPVAAAQLWNSLPDDIVLADSLSTFRRQQNITCSSSPT